ncbi:hypothetical protein NEPAR08_1528 [Nematocida parisii]|nr:hypothetical protein NEPAR03_0603 [Nematocida parisii]KAI5129284.1 hypothetical protein NEPAR08_1528 [Nematocida parisii]
MLILQVLRWATNTKQRVQNISICLLCLFTIVVLYLCYNVSLEEIKCYSDQLIKNAEYSVECTKSKITRVDEYRDSEYDEYSTILLTGKRDAADLIAKIHKTAQEMENRTKGYDIKIGECSHKDMQKYFLVLEIEKSDNTLLYINNQGWQVNSDILSIFCDRMFTADITGISGNRLINLVFNKISLGLSDDGIESVLAILHNIHNLYSHSLGVYFYWVINEKAIFLSSNVLLVLVLGVFLIFLEFITGGSFKFDFFRGSAIAHALLGYNMVFMNLNEMTCFEVFLLYSVLVPLNFPLAVILGVFRVVLFFCLLIGCAENRSIFLQQFNLLYETINRATEREPLSLSFSAEGLSKGKQIPHASQSH